MSVGHAAMTHNLALQNQVNFRLIPLTLIVIAAEVIETDNTEISHPLHLGKYRRIGELENE
jgi:hypothetical protein